MIAPAIGRTCVSHTFFCGAPFISRASFIIRTGRVGIHINTCNMAKEKNYNPVAAQRKADKAKAIKKGGQDPYNMRYLVANSSLQENQKLKSDEMNDWRERTRTNYKNKLTT